jgi:hypothetical protein
MNVTLHLSLTIYILTLYATEEMPSSNVTPKVFTAETADEALEQVKTHMREETDFTDWDDEDEGKNALDLVTTSTQLIDWFAKFYASFSIAADMHIIDKEVDLKL